MEQLDQALHNDPHIFLLNNLLMSVQFFDNYERDVEILRQNWYKELSLKSHATKCFHADSLVRLVSVNVKLSSPREPSDNDHFTLNSSRIYVSPDNVEAAFDPSTMSSKSTDPAYKFTLRTDDQSEKTGYVSLVRSKKVEAQSSRIKVKSRGLTPILIRPEKYEDLNNARKKVSFDEMAAEESSEPTRNADVNEKNKSVSESGLLISPQSIYKTSVEEKGRVDTVQNLKMNERTVAVDRIPSRCFQPVPQKIIPGRRTGLNNHLKNQELLNSAAYKGYFCDLLLEKLWEPLGLDVEAAKRGRAVREFVKVTQAGAQYSIAASVPVRDWKFHMRINARLSEGDKRGRFAWPCRGMLNILDILPCSAVPDDRDQSDSAGEKTWKLCFPKAEEMLTVHMMHAQVKCYLLVLILYKLFLEPEISEASLGPTHLLHLLFWRVHKNFTAWPEDRPAEILISYLKVLYRKLQNKHLADFFVSTRNLFADSVPMDLRRAQVIIKQILESPVAYIVKAIQQLDFHPKFYPVLDVAKIITILKMEKKAKSEEKCSKKTKLKNKYENEEKKEMDEEDEKKKAKSIDTDIDAKLGVNLRDLEKFGVICEIFLFHYMRVSQESIRRDCNTQALFYLEQTKAVLELMRRNELRSIREKYIEEQIEKLRELCGNRQNQLVRNKAKLGETRKGFTQQREEKEGQSERKKRESAGDSNQIITVKL